MKEDVSQADLGFGFLLLLSLLKGVDISRVVVSNAIRVIVTN